MKKTVVFFASLLMIMCLAQKEFAQNTQYIVPAGEVTFLDTIMGSIIYPITCQRGSDYCLFGWTGFENVTRPFLTYSGITKVYISPDSPGYYNDVITAIYFNLGPQEGKCLSDPCGGEKMTRSFSFTAQAYYKNQSLLKAASPVFLYDSLTLNNYKDAIVNLHVTNKNADSIKLTDWKIVKDSSNSIFLNSLENLDTLSFPGNVDTNYSGLILKTFKLVSSSLRHYNLVIRTIAHVAGKDSLCILNLDAVFAPFSNSSVSDKISHNSLALLPNPSKGNITAICSIQNPSLLHLHIFDELGSDIMTIFDGMMNEPHRDFSFTLPPGMYYARMETAEGVVTKKVVVE